VSGAINRTYKSSNMTNTTENIEKRIKRHVQGKTHSFFISTLPGIEQICFDELSRLRIPMADTIMSNGGIEFNGRIHDCYLANLKLKTANRILMRLDTFAASNFRQLEKKISGFPWELYLQKNAAIEVNVTSKHSRLIHTDAIAERVKARIKERLGTSADESGKNHKNTDTRIQQIFVRAENDQFIVSIDSTGILLHKRGLKIQGGRAPVRETIAAAILSLAGYQPGTPLIDPMCGTGTFSLEAAMITGNIPAGWFREFAFMDWPAFKASRWNHLRREAERSLTPAPVTGPMIFASDIDPENSRKLQQVIEKNILSEMINVFSSDFFDLCPENIHGLDKDHSPGLITLNPPYGLRLENKQSIDYLFADIGKKLKKDFKGWKAAILVPDKHLVKTIPFKTTTHDFFHGGLKITLVTGRIR
jgi:putative N6-adenine-specific DNA methylase